MGPELRDVSHRSDLLERVFLLVLVFGVSCLSAFVHGEDRNGGLESSAETVVAEGVGATATDALKDAYRNAVRQVVGAVVDAETLVKNDEIIDDKVLTYSDGFIKTYQEVAEPKKEKGGLIRIKIRATVERRSVVAKLKAANVIVKDIDGKGLFAEVVTQLDAEQDAAALLRKQFEGFPQSCITASIVSKPEILEKATESATIKILIQIEPDLKAFKSFSSSLTPILGKLAKSKSDFTATFGRHESQKSSIQMDAIGDGSYGNVDLLRRWIPIAFEPGGPTNLWKENQLTLAIATNRTKAADRIDYSVFVIDTSLRPILLDCGSRIGYARLQFLDADSEVIATDRVALMDGNFAGNLMSSFGCPFGNLSYIYELGLTQCKQNQNDFVDASHNAYLFMVSPIFLQSRINRLSHKPRLIFPCKLTLGLEELKRIKDAKVEMAFDE